MCGRLDLEPHFLGRLRHERFTSNQIASQHRTSFAGRHKQPIYFFKPQWAGPVLPLHPLHHNNWSLIILNGQIESSPTLKPKVGKRLIQREHYNVHEQRISRKEPTNLLNLTQCMNTHVTYTERAHSLHLNISQIRVEPQKRLKFHRYWAPFTIAIHIILIVR